MLEVKYIPDRYCLELLFIVLIIAPEKVAEPN